MKTPPQHGGRLQAAAEQFNIPESDWLDLSTGINPTSWDVPAIPPSVWQRLPDNYAQLEAAAAEYYQAPVMAIPGSQWAIQNLPLAVKTRRVWLPQQAYEEHQYWWEQSQNDIKLYESLTAIKAKPFDSVVVINPNNPSGHSDSPDHLCELAISLQAQQGYLVLDEAFMDPTPEQSVFFQHRDLPDNMIVLRSLGKFFGMAGLRLGFIYCQQPIRSLLQHMLGPWAISHPASYLGELALRDRDWQQTAIKELRHKSEQLHRLLENHVDVSSICSTRLFSTLQLSPEAAESLFKHCAQQGILLRHFPQWGKIRVGLTTKSGRERLQSALECWDI